MDVVAIFAERLKSLRTEAGLSQGQLGEKLNVSRGSISYYENQDRTPDITFLYAVANYFNTTTDYLLGISDVKHMNSGQLLLQYEEVSSEDKRKIDRLISLLVQEISMYRDTSLFSEFLALKDITIDSLFTLLKGFRIVRCSAIDMFKRKLPPDKENISRVEAFEVYELAEPLKDIMRAMETSVTHVLNRYIYMPMSCTIDHVIKEMLNIELEKRGGIKNLSVEEIKEIIFSNATYNLIDLSDTIEIMESGGEINGEHHTKDE